LLPLHPLFLAWAASHERALRVEALQLVVLAGAVVAGRLAFRPDFAWKSWGLVGVLLAAALGLTWAVLPPAALGASVVAAVGLPAGALLALRRRGHASLPRPSGWNLASAAVIGLLAPVAGLFLAPWAGYLPGWASAADVAPPAEALDRLWAAVRFDLPGGAPHGFTPEDLSRWCWPTAWVVLPLMAWGLWRTLRRGWKQARRAQLALAWLLTLFALVTLTGGALLSTAAGAGGLLGLAALTVLLPVYCVADLCRGLAERLVLAPPDPVSPRASGGRSPEARG